MIFSIRRLHACPPNYQREQDMLAEALAQAGNQTNNLMNLKITLMNANNT